MNILDCVHTTPAHFENGEKRDGYKIWASVHTIPEQFENGRNSDGKNLLQHFDAKEAYLHPKSPSVSFQKCLKMFCFSLFSGVYTMPFPKCVDHPRTSALLASETLMCTSPMQKRMTMQRRILHRHLVNAVLILHLVRLIFSFFS